MYVRVFHLLDIISEMVERYAHLAPDRLALAASRLDSVLGSYDPATGAQ